VTFGVTGSRKAALINKSTQKHPDKKLRKIQKITEKGHNRNKTVTFVSIINS
jgi:DNA-binding PadR family transcriptional regulator